MNFLRKNWKSNAMIHPAHLLTFMEPYVENDHVFYEKSQFHHLLRVEQMRAERSQKPLLLMLLDISKVVNDGSHDIQSKIKEALHPSLREVDIRGWYNYNQTIGVIFTEINCIDSNAIEVIVKKIYRHFCENLDHETVNKINVFFHIYPRM